VPGIACHSLPLAGARPSMPLGGGFDDAQIFVQCFYCRTGIDAARRSLLKLFPESLPVRVKILESLPVFQAQIAIHNQLQCFTHNEIRRSKYRAGLMG
jgi:hypothetical protein